jgi:hypothetical protein
LMREHEQFKAIINSFMILDLDGLM